MARQIDWSRNGAGQDQGFREDAFAEAVAPEAARRQLRMSVGLMVVLGAAIWAIAASAGPSTSMTTMAAQVAAQVQPPHFVRPMTADVAVASGEM